MPETVELLALKELGLISSDHARLKHAITNAAHSVELLLKERLRQINPAFVWENVDKYPNLEARTVTVDTAISRLTAASATAQRNLLIIVWSPVVNTKGQEIADLVNHQSSAFPFS